MNCAIEEDGILSAFPSTVDKRSAVFNMDQTAVYIDNPGRVTVEYRGTRNVDVVQGAQVNGGRCSVFLCASANGLKLPPLVVFAGTPGGSIWAEVHDPNYGHPSVFHTVQSNAYCDQSIMEEWINEV